MAPWQHIDAAEALLEATEKVITERADDKDVTITTDSLLCVIAHVMIAQAKMTARQRA
jgi:hypothetical protein